MVREGLVAAKAAGGGFVLDGIPRNMQQARAVYLIGRELGMTADVALHLQAGDKELMRRLLARAALEHRSDDTADIAQRLALYHEVTSPHCLVVSRPGNPGFRGCRVPRIRSGAKFSPPWKRCVRSWTMCPRTHGSPLTSPAWGRVRRDRPHSG